MNQNSEAEPKVTFSPKDCNLKIPCNNCAMKDGCSIAINRTNK